MHSHRNNLPFFFIIGIALLLNCATEKVDISSVKDHYYFSDKIVEKFTFSDQAREFAAIGDHLAMLNAWDKGCKAPTYNESDLQLFKNQFAPISAKKDILEKSAATKIMILSKLKHQTYNHTFVLTLLQELFNTRYKHLGIEGVLSDINPGDCLIFKENIDDNNPQFSNLIRKAVSIGFQVFPLEYFRHRQRKNLPRVERILRENPEEKILLYTGLINSNETDIYDGSTLAYKIQNELNINPLTINQNSFSERGSRSYEIFFYRDNNLDQSTVFINKKGKSFQYDRLNGWNDVMVFHPRTTYVNGRPDWITNHYSQKIKIDLTKIDLSKPYLIFAMDKNNCPNAIPYDVLEVREGQQEVYMYLPQGEYHIILTNGKEESELIVVD